MDYNLTRSVFITHQFVGFHRWPEAPEQVDYLRNRHRHLFKLRIEVSVEHGDREIEYHMLKRLVPQLLPTPDHNGEFHFGGHACEEIALHFVEYLEMRYPNRLFYRVELSEDGENGSVVEARS